MTVQDLIRRLDQCLPGFAAHLRTEDSLFEADAAHGVFAAFSQLARERDPASVAWAPIANLVNVLVEAGGPLAEAACACLLENLTHRGHPLRPLLQGEAAPYWDGWV